MKLTNKHRVAFVRAVMQDVPKVDYAQQARDLILTNVASNLPPQIKAIWDDPNLRGFIECGNYTCLGGIGHGVRHPDAPFTAHAKLDEIGKLYNEQQNRMNALESQIFSVIRSCSTLKQAKDRLPEFIKYLPDDGISTTKNLPAIANVVSDLIAAGWKGGVE